MIVTEPVYAFHVEQGDTILDDGVQYTVTSVDDDGDYILIETKDDDGETSQSAYAPFSTITVITAFLL